MKFEVGKLYKVTKTTRKGNVIKITEDLGYGEYKYEVVTNVEKDLVGSFVSGSAFADSLKPVEECIVIYRKFRLDPTQTKTETKFIRQMLSWMNMNLWKAKLVSKMVVTALR